MKTNKYLEDLRTKSAAELDAELMKGVESLNAGKAYSADEVDAMLFLII